MRFQHRRPAILLTILLGIGMVGLAVAQNVGWIVLNWRELLPIVLGVPITLLLIAGVVLNTIFLVREMRRNERQENFLNAVTHELKTPIASIRLYLETMQRRPVAEEKRQEFYRIMLSDTDRLLQTVEQVLKAGEVSQRGKARGFEALDMRHAVTESVTRAEQRHHLAPDAITVQMASQPVLVSGSLDDLETALGNLLGNAVKYSPEAARIAVRTFTDENGWACVTVEDQGIGIDKAHLKRIFSRFYRVPARAGLARQGTGLGLFLVRSIARQHGGSVVATSRGEGHGSTFTLRLPPLPRPLHETEAVSTTQRAKV